MHSYLYLNGLRFHYLKWEGDGRAMVLLHGLGSNARIWEFVAPRLAGAGFRVLALDQRGHGLTDPAEAGFDFPTVVRDLHAFVEALDLQRPVLIGHSWGANTVLQYAAVRSASPAGIVLVDGGFGDMSALPGATWERAEPYLTPPDLDGMPRDEFVQRLKGWLGDLYSERAVEIILAGFAVSEDDRIYRRLPIPVHMQAARAIFDHRPSTLFPRLRCPALLCPAVPPAPRAERDELFVGLNRTAVAQAQRLNPLVRTHWFEDTVHDIPLHRPEELAQAIIGFAREPNT